MSAAKGISLRDQFTRLYGYGYSLTSIVDKHHVPREIVMQLLQAAGMEPVEEIYPHAVPEPVEQPRVVRKRGFDTYGGRRAPVIGRVDPLPRIWCAQCDRLVCSDESERCSSPFCKAKAMAA